MREHKNKLCGAAFFAAAIFVFLLSGCADIFDSGNMGGEDSSVKGAVTVYFEELGGGGVLMPESPVSRDVSASERSIMPETPVVSTYASYTLTFIDLGGVKPNLTRNVTASGQTVILDEGTWNVQVDGYIGTYRAASGTSAASITVADGTSAAVSVNLVVLPVSAGAPSGIFAWDINTGDITGISAASILLDPVADGETDISIDLTSAGYSSDTGVSVPAGYYDVYITLGKVDGTTAGLNPVAHIYPGLTTRANYSFGNSQFVSTVMLAGTVTISKAADVVVSGITVTAYRDAARTIPVKNAVLSTDPFGEGVTNAVSAEWVMASIPVSGANGLPASRKPYFRVSVTANGSSYTVDDVVSEPVPDNGMDGIDLAMTIERNEKAITAFSFSNPSAVSINEAAHTITVGVAHGTDRTSLSPEITISGGASISPAPGMTQDFSGPVSYMVTAENNSTQEYVVTVNIESYGGAFYTLPAPATPVLTAGDGSITAAWTAVSIGLYPVG
jgi:hypothetical protein